MKKKQMYLLPILAITVSAAMMLTVASCKKEEKTVTPAPPGNEFLTTAILTCINTTGSDTVIGVWKDLTPDDTNSPDTSKAILKLKENSTYNVTIQLLDETKSPAGVISDDVLARANYHLLCFTPSSSLGSKLKVEITDYDSNNPPLPLGLKDKFTTGAISNGVLNVVLRHQPNVKNGSCDPGSTDMDVNFTVNIY